MKKLLILTAVIVMTSSAGCHCLDWCCNRGPAADPCQSTPTYAAPCAPCGSPCGPCATPGAVAPGPESYCAPAG
jgi:hypothetical protein